MGNLSTMSAVNTDIDIDVADRDSILAGLPCVPATHLNRGVRARHPSGVYFQDIPIDPLTNLSAFGFEEAEALGYLKIDILNNTIYRDVRDEAHLDDLLNKDPDWSLLDHAEIVGMLAHIHSHYGVVKTIRPKSIDDLAIVLALMRPGKRHLLGRSRAEIDADIWAPGTDGYAFKKSHAIAYAASIVVQLNLLCEKAADAVSAEQEAAQG